MLGLFDLYQTRDRSTDRRFRDTDANLANLKARLRSGNAVGLTFLDGDGRSLSVRHGPSPERTISVRITTIIGQSRTESWPLDKLEGQLEWGQWAEEGGALHNRWIENSRPKPPSNNELEAMEKHSGTFEQMISSIRRHLPIYANQDAPFDPGDITPTEAPSTGTSVSGRAI